MTERDDIETLKRMLGRAKQAKTSLLLPIKFVNIAHDLIENASDVQQYQQTATRGDFILIKKTLDKQKKLATRNLLKTQFNLSNWDIARFYSWQKELNTTR